MNVHEKHELSRMESRRAMLKQLKPGQIVAIGHREVLIDMAAYHDPQSRWEKTKVGNLHSFRKPTSEFHDRESLGPTWLEGTLVTVVAILPEVNCAIYGERPWILLLASDHTIGWTYEIDVVKLLD